MKDLPRRGGADLDFCLLYFSGRDTVQRMAVFIFVSRDVNVVSDVKAVSRRF